VRRPRRALILLQSLVSAISAAIFILDAEITAEIRREAPAVSRSERKVRE
jgi:hypothetical protein